MPGFNMWLKRGESNRRRLSRILYLIRPVSSAAAGAIVWLSRLLLLFWMQQNERLKSP